MICQRETPFEPEPPMRMTAFDAHGAYGFKSIYICEHCDAVAAQYETEAIQVLKDFVEKFMVEHCKIKD